MIEAIDLALQIIRVDFFIAFALYSFLYILLSLFIKKPILKTIDSEANNLIAFIGLLYMLFWVMGIFTIMAQNSSQENNELFGRIFGRYWFGFWLQPILWITATQLLRFKAVQKNILSRIGISLVLMISIEKFVILMVTFHRDYLPSTWNIYNDFEINPLLNLLGIVGKIILYLLFTGAFYGIRIWIKKLLVSNPTYSND